MLAVNYFFSKVQSGIQSIAATEYDDTSTRINNKIFGQYVFRLDKRVMNIVNFR
jgi:hypothetical protein